MKINKLLICIISVLALQACRNANSNTPQVTPAASQAISVSSQAAGSPTDSPKFKKVCVIDTQTSKKQCTTVRVREKHTGTAIPQ